MHLYLQNLASRCPVVSIQVVSIQIEVVSIQMKSRFDTNEKSFLIQMRSRFDTNEKSFRYKSKISRNLMSSS